MMVFAGARQPSSAARIPGHPALLGVLALAWALGCATAPPIEDFTELAPADQLYAEGLAELDGGRRVWLIDTTDYPAAVERFQDIIDNYPYSDYAVLSELRIADAYFAQEKYDEALTYYRDFADLHPGHERVPYTLYRAALSHSGRAEDAGRDQTSTQLAIEAVERLLREHPHSAEAREAETLWRDLRTRLGSHVLGIGDFYFDRDEYQSAADRYRSVLDQYPGLGLDAEALYKLGVCYTRMNREAEANRMFQVILENYRGSEIARAAEEMVPAAQ